MAEDDEISLQPYVLALLHHWKLIVGFTLVAAAVAGIMAFATPPTFESTATIAIAAPGAKPNPEAKAYLDLATSDNMIGELGKSLTESSSGGAPTASELKTRLKASAGSDPTLITLKVRDGDREQAARIAGAWAATFVRVANATYDATKDTLKQLDGQMKAAQGQLRQAEDELAAQETRNSVDNLQLQVTAQRNTLADHYADKAALQATAESASTLQARLRQLDSKALPSLSDELSLMSIQLKAAGAPAQLQLSSVVAPSGRTVGDLLNQLEGLTASIAERSAGIDKRLASTQTTLLDLQSRLQRAIDEQASLLARRDSTRQSLKDLDTKMTQARIAAEAGTNQVRVANGTSVSTEALSRGATRNIVLATVLGLSIGMSIALGRELLRSRRSLRAPGPRTLEGR